MRIAPELRPELARIVQAVAIVSPAAFTFAGRASGNLTPPMMGLQISSGMPPLIAELVQQLYLHCFSNRFTGPIAAGEPPRFEPDPTWVDSLARANRGRERWEDGWLVAQGMPNGQVLARRGAETRILGLGEFVNLTGSGMFLPPDTPVRVFLPRDSRNMQPGYYFTFGETPGDSSDHLSMVRFYWNVPPGGAPTLLEALSTELNRWQVPFRFKTGVHPAMLARLDSGVLYTPRRYAGIAWELVSEVHRLIRYSLRTDVPLFTLRLADGLAFAEDPGTQESFGMARCRLLAQSLWLAHQRGAQQVQDRLAVVSEHFHAEGISLERPWLNAGSPDDLAFPAARAEAA